MRPARRRAMTARNPASLDVRYYPPEFKRPLALVRVPFRPGGAEAAAGGESLLPRSLTAQGSAGRQRQDLETKDTGPPGRLAQPPETQTAFSRRLGALTHIHEASILCRALSDAPRRRLHSQPRARSRPRSAIRTRRALRAVAGRPGAGSPGASRRLWPRGKRWGRGGAALCLKRCAPAAASLVHPQLARSLQPSG